MSKKNKTVKESKNKTKFNSLIDSNQSHPDHRANIPRLNRAKGQIEGVERMILDQRYCPDIIAQLKAAVAALKAIEAEILKSHLRSCVRSAFHAEDAFVSEEKILEIVKIISK